MRHKHAKTVSSRFVLECQMCGWAISAYVEDVVQMPKPVRRGDKISPDVERNVIARAQHHVECMVGDMAFGNRAQHELEAHGTFSV